MDPCPAPDAFCAKLAEHIVWWIVTRILVGVVIVSLVKAFSKLRRIVSPVALVEIPVKEAMPGTAGVGGLLQIQGHDEVAAAILPRRDGDPINGRMQRQHLGELVPALGVR